MREQNSKTTVPLDVAPERRTKRFPPRFRPVGRFCELRFRYLSPPTGREREISRPLDHMRQIPFIHSARFLDSTNFYSWLARDVTGSLKRTVRHVGVQAANLHMSKCTSDSVF